jgi:hypothetical protein
VSITLIIEDGSQALNPNQYFVPNANSYATVEDLRDFAQARGQDLPAEDEDCAALLIRAMDYIEPLDWIGYKFARLQPLHWPRYDVMIEGWPLKVNEIPWQLVALQSCVALEYFLTGAELMPTVQPFQHGNVASEEVAGAVRIAYENNGRVLKVAAIEKAQRFVNVLTRRGGLSLIRA